MERIEFAEISNVKTNAIVTIVMEITSAEMEIVSVSVALSTVQIDIDVKEEIVLKLMNV